jgi:hypothetical protein
MKTINFKNYKEEIKSGDLLIYDGSSGRVQYDKGYTDNLKVNGRSVRNVIEESREVLKVE